MDAGPVQSPITPQLLLIVILILINAYFAASEMAIISVNKNRIHRRVEKGNRKAMLVEKLLQEPTSFLPITQVVTTLAGLFNSVSAAAGISVCLGAVLEAWTIPYGETISMVMATVLLPFVTLIFGEFVSKRIALQNAKAYSMFCAKLILITSKIASSLAKTLSWSTRFILRLFGMKDENVEESLSREEVRSMVESGQENGLFDEGKADMIDSVFAFDDILTEEVATPKPDVFCIDTDDPQSEYLDELMEMRHSRIPAYRDSIDNITGILNIRDFVVEARKNGSEHVDISRILRKPFSVLESKNIDDLFREMQSKHQYIAILVDEYEGFSGIITMEDFVEEIMGDIEDEYDEDDEAQTEKFDEHTYVLGDGMSIDDVNEELGLQLENDNHETIPGFLLDLTGQIPENGEKREAVWNHTKFQVKETKYKRIHKVQLVLTQEEGDSEEVQTADSLSVRVGNPFFINTEQRAQVSSICRKETCIRTSRSLRMRQEENAL